MAAQDSSLTLNTFLGSRSHVVAPLFLIVIIAMILVPLPPLLLDLLLTLNITISVSVLMITAYIVQPSSFSVFPSVLLMSTLFRLALNISTTRLILLHGDEGVTAAGRVIASFGQFVVGGNYVVGVIVFLVIIAIQYMVVAHGAVRASEVSARFVLDAMPGKQLSIDADLNSGLITEEEAKAKREVIKKEAEFYGAMDGAIRFTSREALVSIIITLINIVGGLLIGILQKGMEPSTAFQTFTILTIGDGLVSVLPSLFMTISGGLISTRAGGDSTLGADMTKQVLFNIRPMAFAAGALFLLGLVPGLPKIPFFLVSTVLGYMTYRLILEDKTKGRIETKREEEKVKAAIPPEKIEALLKMDILGLEVGYSLIPLVDKANDAPLLARIKTTRKQLALELGIIVPSIRIKDNLKLAPREYQILVKNLPVAKEEVYATLLLAITPGNAKETIKGIASKDPAFGLPAFWIEEKERERAQFLGYTVVDPATVISTHIKEVIKNFAEEIVTRQDTQKLVDNLGESYPKVVEELIPKVMSVGQVHKVIQNLLREHVSVRDLLTILETLADYGPVTRDINQLTELVRQALSRSLTAPYLTPSQELPCLILGQEIEEALQKHLDRSQGFPQLIMPPEMARELVKRIQGAVEKSGLKVQPIVLTSPDVRSHVKKLTERFLPQLVFLSVAEIPSAVKVISLGVI